jgi:hypothetical protein
LLAVTAFAIGFPIWYRWPYEEEKIQEVSRSGKTERVGTGQFTTWRREWGGGRTKHGRERQFTQGKLISVTTFRNGKRTGPYAIHRPNGNVVYIGEYLDDQRVGTWRTFDDQGRETGTSEYRDDKMWRHRSVTPDGIERLMEFGSGKAPTKIVVAGMEQEDRLAKLVREGKIDDPQIAAEVGKVTNLTFVETPLKDAVDFMSQNHDIPIRIDPHHVRLDLPISEEWRGIPLSTALTLIGATNGVSCEYRYGSLWLTSSEDAKDWRDPTGVADIEPPTESPLARAWNEPVKLQTVETPLNMALQFMIQPLAISIDASKIPGPETGGVFIPVTTNLNGVTFRHALAMLLYQTRCRCKLEGETLVILPPEEMP